MAKKQTCPECNDRTSHQYLELKGTMKKKNLALRLNTRFINHTLLDKKIYFRVALIFIKKGKQNKNSEINMAW
jgi:hypothetical protein